MLYAQADMALLVITDNRFEEHEQQLAEQLKKLETPFLVIHNKRDEVRLNSQFKGKINGYLQLSRNRLSPPEKITRPRS